MNDVMIVSDKSIIDNEVKALIIDIWSGGSKVILNNCVTGN